MKHKIVSKSGQMEPFVARESMPNDGHRCGVARESMPNDGHRCGACHNISDAKVRMMNKNQESEYALKMSVCVFLYLLLVV